MAVRAVSGKPYLNPDSARVGGTLLRGVVDNIPDSIIYRVGAEVRTPRTGIGPNDGPESRIVAYTDCIVLMLMEDSNADAKKVLYSHLTASGLNLDPTVLKPGAILPAFPMVIRPVHESDEHLYSPRWRLAQGADQQGVYSSLIDQLDGNWIPLIANGAHGSLTPPWMADTADAINAAYGLVGDPPSGLTIVEL
jgi:hypothetical protein